MENKTKTETENQNQSFLEAALPMIKYLNEHFHPHVTVIITPTGAELLEGLLSTGEVTDFIKD